MGGLRVTVGEDRVIDASGPDVVSATVTIELVPALSSASIDVSGERRDATGAAIPALWLALPLQYGSRVRVELAGSVARDLITSGRAAQRTLPRPLPLPAASTGVLEAWLLAVRDSLGRETRAALAGCDRIQFVARWSAAGNRCRVKVDSVLDGDSGTVAGPQWLNEVLPRNEFFDVELRSMESSAIERASSNRRS